MSCRFPASPTSIGQRFGQDFGPVVGGIQAWSGRVPPRPTSTPRRPCTGHGERGKSHRATLPPFPATTPHARRGKPRTRGSPSLPRLVGACSTATHFNSAAPVHRPWGTREVPSRNPSPVPRDDSACTAGEATDAREPVPTTLGRGVFHRDPLQLRGARAQATGNAGSPIAQPLPRSPRRLHMHGGESHGRAGARPYHAWSGRVPPRPTSTPRRPCTDHGERGKPHRATLPPFPARTPHGRRGSHGRAGARPYHAW